VPGPCGSPTPCGPPQPTRGRALRLAVAVDQVADSTALLADAGRARATIRGVLDGIRPNDR
jgi:hypothetical protein